MDGQIIFGVEIESAGGLVLLQLAADSAKTM